MEACRAGRGGLMLWTVVWKMVGLSGMTEGVAVVVAVVEEDQEE